MAKLEALNEKLSDATRLIETWGEEKRVLKQGIIGDGLKAQMISKVFSVLLAEETKVR